MSTDDTMQASLLSENVEAMEIDDSKGDDTDEEDKGPIPKTLWPPMRIFGGSAALLIYIIMQFVHVPTPTGDDFKEKYGNINFDRVNECFAVLLPMVFMWLFGVIHPNATAMAPMVLMPLLAIENTSNTASKYLNNVALLFVGVFMVARAMEDCNLHRRFALSVLKRAAHTPKTFMISFMVPPFVLSMFSSNAGSCALMMPVALASMQATIKNAKSRGDHEQVKALEWFEKGLYMSIAYSATIGGVATIIATPPNAIVVAKAEENDYPDVTFGQWMGAFMLLGLLLEVACFFVMFGTYGRGVKAIDRSFIELEYNKLGRMNRDEKIVGATFFVLVVWLIFESFTTKQLFGICKIDGNAHHNVETHGHCREKGGKWSGTFQNGSITILLGLFLFLIPSVIDPRRNLLSWKNASAGIPWGLLMLLGSGNALSLAFDKTSTTVYLATFLEPLGQASLFWLVTIVVTLVAFITELASNTATTNILLPIFLKFSNINNRHPLLLAIPCALAASMAFMLPIATPTNAVALGTNKIPFTGFIRAGWKMNVTGIILTIFFVCTLGNWVFEFENVPEGYRTKWACRESNATCPP